MLVSCRLLAISLLLGLLSSCANVPADPTQRPSLLRQGTVLPLPYDIGLYIPAVAVNRSQFLYGQFAQFGHFTEEGVNAVADTFFRRVERFARPVNQPVSLILAMDPEWSSEGSILKLELSFRLLDTQGNELLAGTKTEDVNMLAVSIPNVQIRNLAVRAAQQVMVEIANSSVLSAERVPVSIRDVPVSALITGNSLRRVGTGFFISQSRVLTATTLVDQCLRVDIGTGTARRSGKVIASSILHDLAVLEVEGGAPAVLAFSGGKPAIGTATTSLSYARPKKDADPVGSFSFGNITSLEGVAGAFGVFQFATATKPSTSAAPVVDHNGKLVGIYSSARIYGYLHDQKLLPANTYMGLSERVITDFLRRQKIEYSTRDYADKLTVADRTSAATVQIACYQ